MLRDIANIQPYPFFINGVFGNGTRYFWPGRCSDCSQKKCLIYSPDIGQCSFGFIYSWVNKDIMLGGVLVHTSNESAAHKKSAKAYRKNFTSIGEFKAIVIKLSRMLSYLNSNKIIDKVHLPEPALHSSTDFFERLGKQIQEAFSTLHEYKSFVSAIVKHINVIIEEKYRGQDFESKLSKSTKNEKAIYFLGRMMEGKLKNITYVNNKDAIKDKSKYTKFRFHGLLHKYLQIYEVVFESKRIALINKSSSVEELFTNPDPISVVIQNLIDNAYKYAPHNSTVSIKCQDTAQGIIFSVTSLGPKILHHEEIYTPSYREKEANALTTDGTGFGLFISKTIANELGIKLEHRQNHEPKQGLFYETTFSIFIPPHLFASHNLL